METDGSWQGDVLLSRISASFPKTGCLRHAALIPSDSAHRVNSPMLQGKRPEDATDTLCTQKVLRRYSITDLVAANETATYGFRFLSLSVRCENVLSVKPTSSCTYYLLLWAFRYSHRFTSTVSATLASMKCHEENPTCILEID